MPVVVFVAIIVSLTFYCCGIFDMRKHGDLVAAGIMATSVGLILCYIQFVFVPPYKETAKDWFIKTVEPAEIIGYTEYIDKVTWIDKDGNQCSAYIGDSLDPSEKWKIYDTTCITKNPVVIER